MPATKGESELLQNYFDDRRPGYLIGIVEDALSAHAKKKREERNARQAAETQKLFENLPEPPEDFSKQVLKVCSDAGTVSVASDDKDAVNMEMFDGMDMDKDSLVKALARINGNALSKLVSELLLDHSNIRVLDPEKNTYEVMGEDDFDEIFCQYLAGMLNLCAEVIRLNFSGFFKDASTLFGGLIKVRRAGSSNSTESSTTTE